MTHLRVVAETGEVVDDPRSFEDLLVENDQYCACGCGELLVPSKRTRPKRFNRGHRMRPKPTLEEFFWERVVRGDDDDCWPWMGALAGAGYGCIQRRGKKNRLAHRVAYELIVGPIPEGLTLDHLCHNRICVNPHHLEPVTPGENVLRGEGPGARNARKTHCHKGHPFDDANTIWPKSGGRKCRACFNEYQRQWRKARQAA